jgi:hypothetical protein
VTRNSPGEISISTSTAQAGMSSAASASAAGGAGEVGAAAAAQPQQEGPVVTCKGVNGLDKVVLREVRGSSAEVRLVLPPPLSRFSCQISPQIHGAACSCSTAVPIAYHAQVLLLQCFFFFLGER